MAEFNSTAIRPAGEIRDTLGRSLKVSSDCDAVTLTVPGFGVIRLDTRQRAEFNRLYAESEHAADTWAREHGGSGDA